MLFDTGIIAISITADISKSDDVQRMMENIVSKWGSIDIACNNAGINMNSASEDTSLEEWDRTFNVNLRGTFMCCQVCMGVCVCVSVHLCVWFKCKYFFSYEIFLFLLNRMRPNFHFFFYRQQHMIK